MSTLAQPSSSCPCRHTVNFDKSEILRQKVRTSASEEPSLSALDKPSLLWTSFMYSPLSNIHIYWYPVKVVTSHWLLVWFKSGFLLSRSLVLILYFYDMEVMRRKKAGRICIVEQCLFEFVIFVYYPYEQWYNNTEYVKLVCGTLPDIFFFDYTAPICVFF